MDITNKLLLDTNIIIDWFSGGPSQKTVENYIKRDKVSIFISFITVIEFLSKADKTAEKIFIKTIVEDELNVIYVDSIEFLKEIVEIRKNTGLKIPDAIILASAKVNNLLLLTRDRELYTRGRKFCKIHWIEN